MCLYQMEPRAETAMYASLTHSQSIASLRGYDLVLCFSASLS